MHVLDHPDGSWLQEVEKCQQAFDATPSFKSMPIDARKLVAGWGGQSKGYFGWMGGAGRFKTLTATHPGRIGKFLDKIRLAGAVSTSHAARCLDGIMTLHGLGIGSATRLLSMKRPDLFFSANEATQDKIQDLFGHRCDTTESYLDIIEQMWSYPWFRAPMPKPMMEERLWRARVALVDAVLYQPS
jgi:hypothetical protein